MNNQNNPSQEESIDKRSESYLEYSSDEQVSGSNNDWRYYASNANMYNSKKARKKQILWIVFCLLLFFMYLPGGYIFKQLFGRNNNYFALGYYVSLTVSAVVVAAVLGAVTIMINKGLIFQGSKQNIKSAELVNRNIRIYSSIIITSLLVSLASIYFLFDAGRKIIAPIITIFVLILCVFLARAVAQTREDEKYVMDYIFAYIAIVVVSALSWGDYGSLLGMVLCVVLLSAQFGSVQKRATIKKRPFNIITGVMAVIAIAVTIMYIYWVNG